MEVAIILTNCVLLAWKNKTERERERVARDNRWREILIKRNEIFIGAKYE